MPDESTAIVRVLKRKWDRTVSTVDVAQLLPVPGDTSAWLVPTGNRRERPSRGTIEVVSGDELWSRFLASGGFFALTWTRPGP